METLLDTPPEIRHPIWTELGRAAQDKHHAWRTPVFATVSADGTPNARTVVLREADAGLSRMRFYTDGRSPKVNELRHQPNALLVFWSKRLGWQLRVNVHVAVHMDGAEVDSAWDRLRLSPAAQDYLAPLAPGSPAVPGASSVPAHGASSSLPPNHHLAVLTAHVQDMDWLELARGGHRRARFSTNIWEWLTP